MSHPIFKINDKIDSKKWGPGVIRDIKTEFAGTTYYFYIVYFYNGRHEEILNEDDAEKLKFFNSVVWRWIQFFSLKNKRV